MSKHQCFEMGPLFPIAKMAAEPEKDDSLEKQIQQSLNEFTERHKADLGMAALTYTHVPIRLFR
jgi:hypothetical protein